MKIKKIVISLALISFGLSSAYATDATHSMDAQPTNSQSTDSQTTTPATTTSTSATSATQDEKQKEGELIAFLVVLNQNEIAAANEARKKNIKSEVKSYADLMKTDHTKNLNDTLELSKQNNLEPKSTPMIDSLKRKGEEELVVLAPLDSTGFENAYIDAMVKGHEEALMVIDNNFMNSVKNPTLKTHLETTRSHISTHLEKAKELQKNR
ncbi:MAG: DUF4142 domain-containing protein [Tatlockia sp.]|nr:DUF4142 domain-containing protein [Tatlockia sp.]